MSLKLESAAFKHEGMIASQFTCEGKDVSPALAWSGTPEGTKSWALIMDDPDAPMGTWVHWVLWNLPPTVTGLAEGVPAQEMLSSGAKQGVNDFKKVGYGGPCPPPGKPHRYYFKLYALDTLLTLPAKAAKQQLQGAMKGHILGETQLMGKYQRSR